MKALLIPVFLMFSLCLKGQDDHAVFYLSQVAYYSPPDTANKNNNVLYWSLNLAQRSLLGIRYDHYFSRIGAYGAFNIGKATGGDDIVNKQHRYVVGGIYRLNYQQDQIDSPIASIGIVYHDWLTTDHVDSQINYDKAFRKWSFELGIGGRIKRFNVAGRADFMQMEVSIDGGFNF
jgi:hypothetical protein